MERLLLPLIILLDLCILFNCRTIKGNDSLSLPRKPYHGNELRIDGYYYNKYGNPERIDILFLYNNGIYLYGLTPKVSDLAEYEEMYRSGEYNEYAKKYIYHWGIFVIDGKNIKYEKWVSSTGGAYRAYVYSGEIINQTCFRITKSWREANKAETIEDEDITYYFKVFSPKPSSENGFIK